MQFGGLFGKNKEEHKAQDKTFAALRQRAGRGGPVTQAARTTTTTGGSQKLTEAEIKAAMDASYSRPASAASQEPAEEKKTEAPASATGGSQKLTEEEMLAAMNASNKVAITKLQAGIRAKQGSEALQILRQQAANAGSAAVRDFDAEVAAHQKAMNSVLDRLDQRIESDSSTLLPALQELKYMLNPTGGRFSAENHGSIFKNPDGQNLLKKTAEKLNKLAKKHPGLGNIIKEAVKKGAKGSGKVALSSLKVAGKGAKTLAPVVGQLVLLLVAFAAVAMCPPSVVLLPLLQGIGRQANQEFDQAADIVDF
ncbi:MAG: hypothetical protein AAGI66_09730 [Cyanobacteria bacterium P01_H01_bin.74]